MRAVLLFSGHKLPGRHQHRDTGGSGGGEGVDPAIIPFRPENIGSDSNSDAASTPAEQQLGTPSLNEQYDVAILSIFILIVSKQVMR